ncbi:MAG: hypothetical protein K0S76_2512 [Herbinix sp.]|jgi:cell division protein DivIC|nr:hypothetical protein [Herbinix sp.]
MRRVKKSRTGIGIISLIVLILCGIIAFNKIALADKSEKNKHKIEVLESQKQEQVERKTQIENEKAFRQTPSYIEDVARDKLGLVYEDEIIFKAEEEDDD